MPPLLKKKSEADVPLVPSWHPNFRNFDRLPDTKVVRTAFFINTVAVTVALVLLIYVGRSEWNLHVLRMQVAEQEQLINRDKAASDQAITLFKEYQKEEAKLVEVDNFVKSKPMASQILLHLGQTLPKNIALDRFDLKPNGLTLNVTMRDAPTQAAGVAKAYIEQLHVDKELAIFEKPEQLSSGRNAQTGRITIELLLRLKGAEVKK
jgi:hypothetical protein